jgi:hypothetical protein
VNARILLFVYAALLVVAGDVAALTAPAGANVTTALVVPQACALLAAVAAGIGGNRGRRLGTVLAFLFAALFAWRAFGAHQGGKDYLRNVLAAVALLSVLAGVLLVRARPAQSRT